MAENTSTQNNTWERWHSELELAAKTRGYKTWQTRAKKIVKRYRDERGDLTDDSDTYGTGGAATGARFNILWSNVQTLQPALFAKTPKPVVERRYLDRDDVGRTASVILERALLYELDNGSYQSSLRKSVLDRLLPGRGVVWVRYEPRFTKVPEKTQVDAKGTEQAPTQIEGQEKEAEQEGGDVEEQVASESVPVDYVDWGDFTTSPSRTWEEVWWVDKMVYMTKVQMVKRFGPVGEKVPLDWSPDKSVRNASEPVTGETDGEKRAKIHETWCKTNRKVYWWADGWSDQMLDEKDDPLQLENFWPCPKPLFATLTNDSLVPVPDYIEYQDQAMELDDLTTRITNLTKAIKACGVYDGSVDELKRMFEEGFENRLVPCDNMAEFSSKAGASGMGHIWLLPIKDMVFALNELYKAREQVKQSLYEITGISDIVRGQATSGSATATEQRIKGQFASMRLNEMQAEVARFARDTLRIMGEIISEHYDPMTLYLISGYEQYAKEQFPPEPGMGHNGGPPMESAPPMQAPGAIPGGGPPIAAGALPPDPEALARAKAAEMFKKAIALLKNDKLRGFRIDIETDSLVEPDQHATQQARTELLGAISQFLPQAIEAGAAVPELKPLMARLLMFFLRGFKASRDIESAFEQFIDDVTKEAANPKPKPPSPEEIKANAEREKQQAENAREAARFQMEQQQAVEEANRQREQQQLDLAMRQEEFSLERDKLAMQNEFNAAEHARKMEILAAETEADRAKTELAMQANERKHQLGLEVAEAKAEQATEGKAE